VRVHSPLYFKKNHQPVYLAALIIILFEFIGTKTVFPSQGDSLSVNYNQGINTAAWGHKLQYTTIAGNNCALNFRDILLSSMLKTGSGKKWKDQNNFLFTFSKPVSPLLSLNAEAESFYYRDRQSVFNSDISTHSVSIGATVKYKNASVPFAVGVKNDLRYGHNDAGLSYRISANLPHFKIGNYTNTFYSKQNYDKLNKRRNSDFNLLYNISRKFYNETSDSLRISFGQMRREYYLSPLGDIESRQEKRIQAENKLYYKINNKLSYKVHTDIGSRIMSIYQINDTSKSLSRKREDFFTDLKAGVHFTSDPVRINIKFSHETMIQNYTISGSSEGMYARLPAPDNKSSYTTLYFSGSSLLHTDSVIVNGLIQKLSYDTPAKDNFDDRDELRITGRLAYCHIFSKDLYAEISASINFHHRVYIYGERSGDNNWTRILKLNPSVTWAPSEAFRISHRISVLANYISYDFEELLPGIRSILYRKLTWQDSMAIKITKRNSFRITFQTEFDENGRFLYSRWAEERLFNRNRNILEIINVFKPVRSLKIASGYSYFFQNGKQFNAFSGTSSSLNFYYLQHGPSLEIAYTGKKIYLLMRGNRFVTKTKSLNSKTITRINITLNWSLN